MGGWSKMAPAKETCLGRHEGSPFPHSSFDRLVWLVGLRGAVRASAGGRCCRRGPLFCHGLLFLSLRWLRCGDLRIFSPLRDLRCGAAADGRAGAIGISCASELAGSCPTGRWPSCRTCEQTSTTDLNARSPGPFGAGPCIVTWRIPMDHNPTATSVLPGRQRAVFLPAQRRGGGTFPGKGEL